VAQALHGAGHDVIAVDTSEAAVDAIAPHVTRAAVADGKQLATLERVGARGADAGVVSTGEDVTASILAAMALRDLGVQEIYAKVVSLDHARVMNKMGVTESIFPERESALRLATRMSSRGILNYVRLGADFSVQEMAVPQKWIGRSLLDLQLPRRYGISVVAVHDMLRDEIVPVSDPQRRLTDSDTILVAGKDADLQKAAQVE
jgi:trk system potassium uptake protein TrkA